MKFFKNSDEFLSYMQKNSSYQKFDLDIYIFQNEYYVSNNKKFVNDKLIGYSLFLMKSIIVGRLSEP